jgi:hypothetical protein
MYPRAALSSGSIPALLIMLSKTGAQTEVSNSSLTKFDAHCVCNLAGDSYCFNYMDDWYAMLESAETKVDVEELVRSTLINQYDVSYSPLVYANIKYWDSDSEFDNETNYKKEVGFEVDSISKNFEVKALAVGVIIKGVTSINPIHGIFTATLKLYFHNTTQGPFQTVDEATDTIYANHTRTVAKRNMDKGSDIGQYLMLHGSDEPYVWTNDWDTDNETPWPDSACDPAVISTMEPINANSFNTENLVLLPSSNSKIALTKVFDDAGKLHHIDTGPIDFKFKPINHKYYPFQIDLVDLYSDMSSSTMIQGGQKIVKYMMCLEPNFSGFSNHVVRGRPA